MLLKLLLPTAQRIPGDTFWAVTALPLTVTLKLKIIRMEEMKEDNEGSQIADTSYYFPSLLLSREMHALVHTKRRKAHLRINTFIK